MVRFNKIKEIRESKGLTQKELAQAAKLSQTFISDLENNKTMIKTKKQLESLAKALDLTPEELRDLL